MPIAESPPGTNVRIDGQEYLYFVGTGYLGLQNHPEVIQAACQAAQRYGIGSANSRTAFGTTPPVVEVERREAAMFGLDDAFYFASGWMGGNILTNMSLPESGRVFLDECSHYSIFEAARLSGWPNVTFRHRDPDDLRAKLREHVQPGQNALVLTDGVFAATGRIAPVAEYHAILQDYPGSAFFIDDAHGIAVLGENGRGTFEHAGLWGHGVNSSHTSGADIPVCLEKSTIGRQECLPHSTCHWPHLIFCGTLSKAVGGFGGIIPGDSEFIRRLKMRSPYFGGASAPPTPIAAATAKALELIAADPSMRTRLRANARLLKDGLRGLGFDVDDSPVPIASLVLGDAENMQRIQRALMQRGILVAYMATYSGLGPEGAFRIAVFATHTPEMIARLLDELRRIV